MNKEVIYIAADHAGYNLKEKIKKYLNSKNIIYEDLGGNGDKDDDYPDFAFKVAKKVSINKNSFGILSCGTGMGMAMAANKVKGIRAALAYDKYSAVMARKHNNSNVLCLRARKFSSRKNIKFVKLFLNQEFTGEERHKRRISKINTR